MYSDDYSCTYVMYCHNYYCNISLGCVGWLTSSPQTDSCCGLLLRSKTVQFFCSDFLPVLTLVFLFCFFVFEGLFFSPRPSGFQGLGPTPAHCGKSAMCAHLEQGSLLMCLNVNKTSLHKCCGLRWPFSLFAVSQYECAIDFFSSSFPDRKLLWRRRAKCLSHGRTHRHLFIWSITSSMWPIQRSSWKAESQLWSRSDLIRTGRSDIYTGFGSGGAAVNVYRDGKGNCFFMSRFGPYFLKSSGLILWNQNKRHLD